VPGDRLEVRGLIEALLGPAVDPADAAGRQDLDAGGRRDLDRRGNSRSAERTRGQDGRDVADRDLGHPGLVREPLEKHIARADDRDTVVQRDRCGHHPECADLRLERPRGGQVARARQPVRDDGRFERDHRRIRFERFRDLGCDRELHRRPEA